jgi:ergothioneine biosynthesis protein EgtB
MAAEGPLATTAPRPDSPDVGSWGSADALAGRFLEVRGLTETLAAPLSAEDQTVQSMPDTSPTKWHRAHTTWFFETFLLGPHLSGYRPFDARYGYLFNSYYEALGARHPRPERGLLSRPGISEIAAYRRHVDGAMLDLLATPLAARVAALTELGVHHEQQHQELLLMDIKHLLSLNPLAPAYRPGPPPATAGAPRETGSGPGWTAHPGGLVEIGHDGEGFAFDNESPRHGAYVHPFTLADRPATCGEWQAFIADGGYRRPELWLSEGWATVQTAGWEAPLYWSAAEDRTQVFTLGGLRPLAGDEPVCHVSYFEADAFARWSRARLPTEAEWEVVAADRPVAGRFLDLDVLHPRPVGPGPGPQALFGDLWQWTASAYLPYPGFAPAAGAVGEYNGKFMVNQQVLRGGCCATPAGHVRTTYRNFFPASARWPFTGVRLARDS